MHNRDTSVMRRFPIGKFQRFVLFPLPEGGQYRAYLDEVLAKLPKGTMASVQVGGREILAGPASALPLLFPRTAREGF
jgi:hypothetical protein